MIILESLFGHGNTSIFVVSCYHGLAAVCSVKCVHKHYMYILYFNSQKFPWRIMGSDWSCIESWLCRCRPLNRSLTCTVDSSERKRHLQFGGFGCCINIWKEIINGIGDRSTLACDEKHKQNNYFIIINYHVIFCIVCALEIYVKFLPHVLWRYSLLLQ